jgi:hypothetical protein
MEINLCKRVGMWKGLEKSGIWKGWEKSGVWKRRSRVWKGKEWGMFV